LGKNRGGSVKTIGEVIGERRLLASIQKSIMVETLLIPVLAKAMQLLQKATALAVKQAVIDS